MAKWFVAAKRADFDKIGKTFGISPVLARIIRNRGLAEEEDIRLYLQGGPEDFHDGSLMKDMDRAADILRRKIRDGAFIRIIGDYDADGICAAAILFKGLARLGARVDSVIPHRVRDGYGLNGQLVREAAAEGVDTLLTCDNGIAAAPQLRLAEELGLTCIVTDHHEVPYEENEGKKRYLLPPAAAVADPKREDCAYPNKNLCGAGIAWKLVEKLWEGGGFSEEEHREFLELAAVATVCDVMELQRENRILVKEGLKSLKRAVNPGLRALLKVQDISPGEVSAYHLGFVLGPCLNATGRLDTAERALKLLLSRGEREAVLLALELKQMNENRKRMTEEGLEKALRLVKQEGRLTDRVLVVYLPDCHESLAGLIAGRLKEAYYRPVFVLTPGEEGVKGSGRSIEGYHMYEEMSRCKELFTRYGGHRQAAGFSMEADRVELFRRTMNDNCTLAGEDMEEKILIDVPLPLSCVTPGFIEELALLEPFGMGNAKPVFAQKNLRFLSLAPMGKNGDMARFSVEDEQKNRFTLTLFRGLSLFAQAIEEKYGQETKEALFAEKKGDKPVMNVIYYPSFHTWKGRREIQFVMQRWS